MERARQSDRRPVMLILRSGRQKSICCDGSVGSPITCLVRRALHRLRTALDRARAGDPHQPSANATVDQIGAAVDGADGLQSEFPLFVCLGIDDHVWMYTPFTKNREELLKTNLSGKVMLPILKHPEARSLFSDEHLFLDGAWVKVQAFMSGFQSNERAPHRQTRPPPPLPLSPSPKKSGTWLCR